MEVCGRPLCCRSGFGNSERFQSPIFGILIESSGRSRPRRFDSTRSRWIPCSWERSRDFARPARSDIEFRTNRRSPIGVDFRVASVANPGSISPGKRRRKHQKSIGNRLYSSEHQVPFSLSKSRFPWSGGSLTFDVNRSAQRILSKRVRVI
jgi:hypothetical protein